MKSEDSARSTALSMLNELDARHASLEDLFERLRRTSMDSRDRRFVRQLVTGTLKWRRRLDWIVDQFARRPIASLPTSRARNLLRLGVINIYLGGTLV